MSAVSATSSTDEYGREWRFHVADDGTITRGRKYQCPDDGGDSWRWYWGSDTLVAFIDGGYRYGVYAMTEGEDTERAMAAYRAEKTGKCGAEGALDRLAERLTGQADARFIAVSLDRDTDLYALSWDGDPEHEWRDEIEAVYNGDVWRIEVEGYTDVSHWGWGTFHEEWEWQPTDDICEEFYGEDKADEGWQREFPLAEFPAERLIGSES